jgi:hypothetical protein
VIHQIATLYCDGTLQNTTTTRRSWNGPSWTLGAATNKSSDLQDAAGLRSVDTGFEQVSERR